MAIFLERRGFFGRNPIVTQLGPQDYGRPYCIFREVYREHGVIRRHHKYVTFPDSNHGIVTAQFDDHPPTISRTLEQEEINSYPLQSELPPLQEIFDASERFFWRRDPEE